MKKITWLKVQFRSKTQGKEKVKKIGKKIVFLSLMVIFALGLLTSGANAALQSVGPREIPSPPGNGFPTWYQDTNGLTLDYCLPRNQVQLDAGVCLILPTAQDPVNGFDLPFVFPGNYPDEAFYFNATAVVDLQTTPTVFNAVLVLGLEGAFATGPVVAGDQITFSRLRIVVDAPVAGNYTVTTPYGVYQFPNVAVGKRAIVAPFDIGIGAPGDFTGALQGNIGPFLQRSLTPGGAPLAPVTIPLDPSGDLFLSDTATPVPVTGSPGNTNYFEICTDGGVFQASGTNCVRQNLFTLMGRVFNGTPFNVNNSYYMRDASGAGTVNVFGLTSSVSASAVYTVSGTGLTSTPMLNQTPPGNLFASIPFATGTTLPATVTTTATDAVLLVANTVINTNLTDLVLITSAVYNAGAQTLTINATSSDLAVPPTLTATGGLGTLVNGVLTVTNVIAPPATVTVTSSKGGTGTAIVVPGIGGPVVPKVAINDLNGDGSTDVLWRNTTTGDVYLWLMNGTSIIGGGALPTVPLAWSIAGSGDFDNDGKSDLLWRNTTSGEVSVWLMNGISVIGGGALPIVPLDWTIEGVGDFNNDGKADILWRNPNTGEGSLWLMNGSSLAGGGPLPTIPLEWTIATP